MSVFAVALAVSALLGSADQTTPALDRSAEDAPVDFSFVSSGDGQLHIAIGNKTDQAVNINLGRVMANGEKLVPSNLTLVIKEGERVTKKQYTGGLPMVGGFGGRIDDYIVPLAPHGYYQFSVKLTDFISVFDMSVSIPLGKFRASLLLKSTEPAYVNSDMEGVRLIKLWNGEVRSDEVEMTFKLGG